MRRLSLLFLLIVCCPTAFALNNRSAVSVNGLDTNLCTVQSPCRSFNTALANTVSGGEVIALDSAGYGPFSITQSATVSGAPGVHAALTVPTSSTGINISGISSLVVLRNLVLIGGGTANYGIFANGSDLRVINCVVRGFNAVGLLSLGPNATIEDSAFLDNYTAIQPTTGHTTISRTLIENYNTGIDLETTTNADVVVSDSVITNGNTGVFVHSDLGAGSVLDSVTLENCKIAYNGVGVIANAIGGSNAARVYLSQNVISYNGTGAGTSNSGVLYSFGNNRFSENGSDGSAMTAAALK